MTLSDSKPENADNMEEGAGKSEKSEELAGPATLIIYNESPSSKILPEDLSDWSEIFLDLHTPSPKLECFTDELESADSISLCLSEGADLKIIQEKLAPYLIQILGTTTSLQSLEIDVSIFKNDLTDVFSNASVRQTLSHLDSLAIQKIHSPGKHIYYIEGMMKMEDFIIKQNFHQLAKVAFHLKQFSFGKILDKDDESRVTHVTQIPKFIKTTTKSLEDLELHLNVWNLIELREIFCPNLKRLVLSPTGEGGAEHAVTFLKNHPGLEELVIELKKDFPLTIFQALESVSGQVKKLHLKANRFHGPAKPFVWAFLEKMENLTDFQLRKLTSPYESAPNIYRYGAEILAELPASIEKISLQGFQPFWQEVEEHPQQERNIGDLFSRFENLTEINLLRSEDAVCDEGLQKIIINCKKLTTLVFSHCQMVTDFGISGIPKNVEEQVEGVSLKNLKDLISLKIRCCPDISPVCLAKQVDFEYLRSFDYVGYFPVSKGFVNDILHQNPCLEELTLDYAEKDLEEIRKNIKLNNPRVRLIKKTSEIWEQEDSDADASSLPDVDGVGREANVNMDDYVEDIEDFELLVDEDFLDSNDDI